MIKKSADLFCVVLLLFPILSSAEEPGYREALDYFVVREKAEKKSSGKERASKGETARMRALKNPSGDLMMDAKRFFVSLGVGEVFDSGFYSVEAGVSVLQTQYVQQNLYLEYINFSTKDLPEYQTGVLANSSAQSLILFHEAHLSSQYFFLSPELSIGVGRVFDEPRRGALMALKAGAVYSGHWRNRLLFSVHFYYRRSQYFTKDFDDDGLGLSLRVGF